MIYKRGDIHGVDVALVVSGMGEGRAYAAARLAIAALRPSAYVSAGFSGALKEGIRAGELVIGESTISLARAGDVEYRCDAPLLKAALDSCGDCASGGLVTMPRTLVTAEEKRKAALSPSPSTGPIAADMESAGAARAAHEAGVPFIAIRAITDAFDEDMPVDFNRFIEDGRLCYPRFIMHVIAHPGALPGLIRLGRNSRLAARNLGEVVSRLY